MFKVMLKKGLTLFTVCLISGLLLSLAHEFTKERIQMAENAEINSVISEFFPTGKLEFLTFEATELVSEACCIKDADSLLGYIFMAHPIGYDGEIKMVVAFDDKNTVLGYSIISHTETSSLGGKYATDQEIIDQFKNKIAPLKAVENPNEENEVSTMSGVTITTNAIIKGINSSYEALQNLN